MADGENTEGLKVTTVAGSTADNLGMTIAEGQQSQTKDDPAVALGVTPEQYAKFHNAETNTYNWQAHAKEAEFRAEQRKPTEAKPDEKPAEASPDETVQEAQTAVEKAGLNWDTLETKIIDGGDIEAGDYEALAKIGIPENLVKDYISSVTERASAHVEKVMSAFGGKDRFDKVSEFVTANYSEAEVKQLELQLTDPAQFKLTADMLMTKAALPPAEDGQVVHGPNASSGTSPVVAAYANQSEMIADQKNPRYKSDPAFRNQVMARARVSTWGNNPRAHTAGI